MPPVDSTPHVNTGNFELLYSLKAYDKIPVYEYKSKYTGLTVVIAEVEGPVVDGFFCLVTEAFDDDGLPHTLEHLIFLGSEQYPYKGVLDLLANRCLASGTNAWTDTDHTCYTMETAGDEGFLTLMPIFLDHILYPILSDEGFITEVHHVTEEGFDAGVVYCEMQARENSAESRLHLTMSRKMYPGQCGYSSETGGIMKNLRESCNNTKVRNYHREFYRPENLKIIITGQIKAQDVFKALAPLEAKIISKGDRESFTRPWQSPVTPLPNSEDLIIKYPSDDESNGIFSVAWRGPSAVDDVYTLSATSIFLEYLTAFSVSPLPKEFVEIDDPYASQVFSEHCDYSTSCLYLIFQNVPCAKLAHIKTKLNDTLRRIYESKNIDMEGLKNIIRRRKLKSLSSVENSPHHTVTMMIIAHMLYGDSKGDLQQRLNPLIDLDKMLNEPVAYWLDLLRRYFIENKYVAIQCVPSVEEQQRMANEERERIAKQIEKLQEAGLKARAKMLEDAINYNERPPPDNVLTSVPIPMINSIKFHDIVRYSSDSADRMHIDLSQTPVFTYFDHVKTNFVYMFALLDTSSVSLELRYYLPLLLETILESPIKTDDGNLISHEDVITELNNDTISNASNIGAGSFQGRFACGSYSNTATVFLQVEASKYEKGIQWLKKLLYQTVLTAERLKIMANKMVNDVAQAKRQGRGVVSYVMKGLRYVEDSNPLANGILKQHKFLLKLLDRLETDPKEVLDKIEQLRQIITAPSNVVLYLAGNLDILKPTAGKAIDEFLPKNLNQIPTRQCLKVTKDWKLLRAKQQFESCIVGMGCLESSYFCRTVPSICNYSDPDHPALLVYLQYLTQAEGPMWKQIRGKGFSYNYTITLKVNEGLLYLVFAKATNVVGAYKEALDIVMKQVQEKVWDTALLESAKSSLLFEQIEEEKTIGSVVMLSLISYFDGVDYKYKRSMLSLIADVTTEDLNRVGDKYVRPLFEAKDAVTAVVCDSAKADEIKAGFEKFNQRLKVYHSLEESFLNL